MEEARELLKEGVLSHLTMLERESVSLAKKQHEALQQQDRVNELRTTVERLRTHRDQLRAKVASDKFLQQENLEQFENFDDAEGGEAGSQLQLSVLMARMTQVKDLLHAHHSIGGYDMTETRGGKGVCVSLATAFEGHYLETYSLEMDLTRVLRICRHNIPPFIPLEKLTQQFLQTDLKAFLNGLRQHLNAFVGRRQQVRLVQEHLQGSVNVMESNSLCNLLVLMCTAVGEKVAEVLCTLQYSDPVRCLPTRVNIESEDEDLPGSQQWMETQTLLLKTPAHRALLALKQKGWIA